MSTLFYLHGFNSSTGSYKACQTREWFATNKPAVKFVVPQLPDHPGQIPDVIDRAIELHTGVRASQLESACNSDVALIGSSMGGFFANYFAEKYRCKAVLINPVVFPHRMLQDHLGRHRNPYTGVEYSLEQGMIAPLSNQVVRNMHSPARRFVMLQKGDEVLDYREAENFYASSHLHVEDGGDHSFVNYDRWLPRIALFLGL